MKEGQSHPVLETASNTWLGGNPRSLALLRKGEVTSVSQSS